MNIQIRPMNHAEMKYAFTRSTQIMGQTGCIGHLRADMDTNGTGFFSGWEDHRSYLKRDAERPCPQRDNRVLQEQIVKSENP